MKDDKEQKDRDWDKEMREVDRLLAKLPTHEASPRASLGGDPTAVRAAAGTTGAMRVERSSGEWLGTWARVALGLLIGVGMTQWPYTHGCGLRLGFYLTGVLAVIVAGLWSSLSSWRRRMGLAHIFSQVLIIWGLVLAAREVLPRIGYAQTTALWLCPDVEPTPGPASRPRPQH
ncbi:MAG TPA: hypothetical protein VLT79_08190 [Gemmatimonadales bacterium]|nr:hypothetical protein [Gemmatimonadales bacterium]